MRLYEYWALLVMTASFLLWSSDFLQPGDQYYDTQEFETLHRTILNAADSIRLSAERYIAGLSTATAQPCPDPMTRTIQAATLLFPLYSAYNAAGLPANQRNWFREALWLIGERAFIPKAMAMVT